MHTFFEFPQLVTEGHGVFDVQSLQSVMALKTDTAHAFSGEAVYAVKVMMNFDSAPQLKSCRFAFADNGGYRFAEIDSKGKVNQFAETPDWFIPPADFARSQWLVNRELEGERVTKLINYILKHDVSKRRSYCDLLFNLGLSKAEPGNTAASTAGKTGNKHGKSTKPRVLDLGSFELFQTFFERLKTAVNANAFPTLQVLTGMDDLTKAPNNLKQGVRTWFKAITGDLPPNNKRVQAGNAALYCAPVREQISEIERAGLEAYYPSLSQAIAQAGEGFIADFSFTFSGR